MYETIIGITGKICCGKSTFSKSLSDQSGWPVMSFGKYLVDYSIRNGLSDSRPDLQNLGDKMVKDDPLLFLNNVFNFTNIQNPNLIVEGIRHKVIWDALKDFCSFHKLVFVEASQVLRFNRFCQRLKPGDFPVSIEEFLLIDNHSVEQEIESLKATADYLINSESEDESSILTILTKKSI